jgi:rubrerythrin
MSTNREAPNAAEKGTKAYKEKIHRESKYAKDHKNLPISFSKPKKQKAQNILFICLECGHEMFITEDTLFIVCSACNKLNRTKPKKED